MRQFIKFVFASAIGFFISMMLVLTIGVIFVLTTISSIKKEFKEGLKGKQTTKISDNAVLKLEFDFPMRERSHYRFKYGDYELKRNLGLNDVLKNIERAKTDSKVKGIYLDLDDYQLSMVKTEEIRDELVEFKESGKFIYAYGDNISQKAFYMASLADNIFLNPNGYLFFNGLNIEMMFLKNTLKKLKVEPQIFRSGKYKSAIEPFSKEKMSEANRKQTSVFLNSMYQHMLDGIAEGREVKKTMLDSIADNLLVRKPEDAERYKLIDALYYHDEVLAALRSELELEEDAEVNFVSMTKYDKTYSKDKFSEENKIAVIYGVGGIQPGDSKDEDVISADRMAEAIKEAREDSAVKAIVLRINSPGGSALASDIIWRETVLSKKSKPLIVSMGDVAASGGYYISCAADTIVAEPNTITGSIGVFGVLPNTQKFFNEKLGITFDRVGTGKYSDFVSLTRPLTEEEKQIVQNDIDRIYKQFVTRVAEGRGLSYDSVHAIAQGRVWTGEDAKRVGLVDVLGGREEAIDIAANLAGLEEYDINVYPKRKDPFERLMEELTGNMQMEMIRWKAGQHYIELKEVTDLLKMQGIQARLPCSYNIY